MKSQNTKVFFRYETEEVVVDGQPKIVKKENGKTEAIMINSQTGEEIARREVTPRHGDKPNKVVGRKYVFKKLMTKALNENLIPKQEVGELWKSFGATCKQPSQKLAY